MNGLGAGNGIKVNQNYGLVALIMMVCGMLFILVSFGLNVLHYATKKEMIKINHTYKVDEFLNVIENEPLDLTNILEGKEFIVNYESRCISLIHFVYFSKKSIIASIPRDASEVMIGKGIVFPSREFRDEWYLHNNKIVRMMDVLPRN